MKTTSQLIHQHRVAGEERVIYYVGDGDDCVLLDEWVERLQANAWHEGFDAGEKDVFDHENHSDGFGSPCIQNPYEADE